jgi:O-antigen ligase
LAGDALRYSVGWIGWGILIGLGVLASVFMLFAFDARATLRRIPDSLAALLALMALSLAWSQYRPQTLLALTLQLGATAFALFLVNQFGWRQLLNILANTIRFILVSSLLFELLAAFLGRIEPLFPNYEGEPPASAYLWSQGNLFNGERIQGVVGNANLLAFLAVLGALVFLVEFIVTARRRSVPLGSIALSLLMAVLAQSATMQFAAVLVLFAALVAILAEGKDRPARRRIYLRAIISLGVVGYIAFAFRTQLFELVGRSSDATGRFDIWASVWRLVVEKPVEGWGWIGYWVPGVEPWEGFAAIGGVPLYQAHNATLDVLVQLGILGVIVFIWLMVETFVRLWHIAVRHTSPLYFYPLFIFLVLAAQSLAESRLLIEGGWVLLVLIATKGREGFSQLEPMGTSTKLSKVLRLINRRFRKLQSKRARV